MGPPRWQVLFDESDRLADAQRFAESIAVAREALAEAERDPGADPLNLAQRLNKVGKWVAEADAPASPLFLERALALRRLALPAEHVDLAESLSNLGTAYYYLERQVEAEPLFIEALTLRTKLLGERSADAAESLNDLGLLYLHTGNYRRAEEYFLRALSIREEVLGPEHIDLGQTLADFAIVYRDTGRLREAQAMFERSLRIYEQAEGPNSRMAALVLNRLGILYQVRGPFAPSVPLFERAIAITRTSMGDEHSNVAVFMNNLGTSYRLLGRYAEAESTFRQAIARLEKSLGPEHPETVFPLGNLADLYASEGRYAAAEPLLLRAMAVNEKALGTDNPNAAEMLDMLAVVYRGQQRYADAARLHESALAILERSTGSKTFRYGKTLFDLAEVRRLQGSSVDAETLYRRALATLNEAVGREHPDGAAALLGLAQLYRNAGRLPEALQAADEARVILELTSGRDHPEYADALRELADIHAAAGRPDQALVATREATVVLTQRLAVLQASRSSASAGIRPRLARFAQHVRLLAVVEPGALAESFAVAQLARTGDTAAQVAQMAARYAAGSDRLAQQVRALQDAAAQVEALDAELLKELARPTSERSTAAEANVRAEQARLRREIDIIEGDLGREFPRYQSLVGSQPLTLVEARRLLRPHEALVSYLVSDEGCFVWVIRSSDASRNGIFMRLPIERAALDSQVRMLRAQLDNGGLASSAMRTEFDASAAYTLYRAVLAPVAAQLQGASHLLLVPHGPLESIPFNVLVTTPPKPGQANADLAWLIKRYALVTLPAEGSLRALRAFASARGSERERKPFVGFGDPLFATGNARASLAVAGEAVGLREDLLRLPRLPDTAHELRSLAAILHGDPRMIHLREEATETQVKQLRLEDFNVVVFATHGLMAGDLTSLREPALVLTVPAEATAQDDGLLMASEIAQLRLRADWVLLSACNTAAPDGSSGAEGLSGLAKAFFYAGARSLLVSHWPVESGAAVALTTATLRYYRGGASKAEALRRAMLEVMRRDNVRSQPQFWAPFVVAGEDNAGR